MFENIWKIYILIALSFIPSLVLSNTDQEVNLEDLTNLKDGGSAAISMRNYTSKSPSSWMMVNLDSASSVTVTVQDVPPAIQFLVFQAHAHLFNISLSYSPSPQPHLHVNGTNTGLIWQRGKRQPVFYLLNRNPANVTIMLAVVGYSAYEPVPGGCNMEFEVEIAPYLRVWYTDSVVFVESQPASFPGISCAQNVVSHETYRQYLPERDFSALTYFSVLKDMLLPQDAVSKGTLAPTPVQGSQMRRVYSVYPGTGSVYVVVARSLAGESAYVPAITYGCSSLDFGSSCEVLSSTFSKVLCASILFLGIFMCFMGHNFFKTQMFLTGCMTGGLLTYIFLSRAGAFGATLNIVLSCTAAATAGVIWLLVWFFFGIPVISLLLPSFLLGFVCAGVVFFAGLGDLQFAQLDLDYWLTFICIMLTVPLLLATLSQRASILSSAVLGAYAVVVPVDHYVGGSLKYIVGTVLRRATVGDFQAAILDPPFQLRDAALTITWGILAMSGFALQARRERGRPPFPPASFHAARARTRYNILPSAPMAPTSVPPSVRTPLRVQAHIPYRYGSVGDDDVFESPPGQRQKPAIVRWLRRLFSKKVDAP